MTVSRSVKRSPSAPHGLSCRSLAPVGLVLMALIAVGCSKEALPKTAGVVHVDGVVEVSHGAAFVPVVVGSLLTATDTIRTGPSAFTVLDLSNGRLVKIDADVSIPVEKIAAFSAEPTSDSVDTQLDFLFTADERATLPAAQALAERVAGFQNRRRAGVSVGAQVAPSAGASAEPVRIANDNAVKEDVQPAEKASNQPSEGAGAPEMMPEPPPPPPPATTDTKKGSPQIGSRDGAPSKRSPGRAGDSGRRERSPAQNTLPGGAEDADDAFGGNKDASAAPKAPSEPAKEDAARAASFTVRSTKVMPPDVAKTMVRRRTAELRWCVEQSKATQAGELLLRISVDTKGTITKVEVLADTLKTPALTRCVTAKVKRWPFPTQTSTAEVVIALEVPAP